MVSLLKTIDLFSSLDDDDVIRLQSICRLCHYKNGDVLFYEGDPSTKLYLLFDGIVKAYKTDMKENEIILHYFYPVALVAEMANFHNIPFPATTEFQSDGRVLEIDYLEFENGFMRNPNVSFEIILSLSQKLRYLDTIITNRLALDSTSRVAKFLYENESALETMRHNKIATILGLTPETLSRVYKKFKTLGLISDDGKNFRVLHREGLKELFS